MADPPTEKVESAAEALTTAAYKSFLATLTLKEFKEIQQLLSPGIRYWFMDPEGGLSPAVLFIDVPKFRAGEGAHPGYWECDVALQPWHAFHHGIRGEDPLVLGLQARLVGILLLDLYRNAGWKVLNRQDKSEVPAELFDKAFLDEAAKAAFLDSLQNRNAELVGLIRRGIAAG